MKHLFLLITVLSLALSAGADVPQFSYNDFTDWVYNNPYTELNSDNIKANRIYLYKTSTGINFTLTSPRFVCHAGEKIDMDITWITDQWQDPGFVVSKVALTAALLDDNGAAVDSVTFKPTTVSRTNQVLLSIKVPRGLSAARLRFASWKADVNSNGAVREIVMTTSLPGDVNLDGEVSIADINAVISVILGKDGGDEDLRSRADVNQDNEVTISDINAVIAIIFGW